MRFDKLAKRRGLLLHEFAERSADGPLTKIMSVRRPRPFFAYPLKLTGGQRRENARRGRARCGP